MGDMSIDYGKLRDTELIVLVKNGDADAFDVLLRKYMPMIRGTAHRYSGTYGAEHEDFLQEAMITLFRAVQRFDPEDGAQFGFYASVCINNAMISLSKKRLKHLRNGRDFSIHALENRMLRDQAENYSNPCTVEESYINNENMETREKKIETLLSDFERRVLKLYLEGNSYSQISQILVSSTKAVDNALQRVRRKLRSEF